MSNTPHLIPNLTICDLLITKYHRRNVLIYVPIYSLIKAPQAVPQYTHSKQSTTGRTSVYTIERKHYTYVPIIIVVFNCLVDRKRNNIQVPSVLLPWQLLIIGKRLNLNICTFQSRLKSQFLKFYSRYNVLVSKYSLSLGRMLTDVYTEVSTIFFV